MASTAVLQPLGRGHELVVAARHPINHSVILATRRGKHTPISLRRTVFDYVIAGIFQMERQPLNVVRRDVGPLPFNRIHDLHPPNVLSVF